MKDAFFTVYFQTDTKITEIFKTNDFEEAKARFIKERQHSGYTQAVALCRGNPPTTEARHQLVKPRFNPGIEYSKLNQSRAKKNFSHKDWDCLKPLWWVSEPKEKQEFTAAA